MAVQYILFIPVNLISETSTGSTASKDGYAGKQNKNIRGGVYLIMHTAECLRVMTGFARFSGRQHATAAPSRHLQKGIRLRSRGQGINLHHHQSSPPTAVDYSAICSAQRPTSKTDSSPLFHPNTSLPPPILFAAPPHCGLH
jgi:hypothetical protein